MPARAVLTALLAPRDPNVPVGHVLGGTTPIERCLVRQKTVRSEGAAQTVRTVRLMPTVSVGRAVHLVEIAWVERAVQLLVTVWLARAVHLVGTV